MKQENNAEAVLRIIGTAIGVGIGINSIVKAGTSAFKAVAATYGDDVARAIAEYGDDIAKITGKYGDDVAKQVDDIISKEVYNGNIMSKPFIKTQKNVNSTVLPKGSQWERNVLNSFSGGKAIEKTYEGGTTLYRIGGKNGGFWSLDPPPITQYQWRVNNAIKQEFCNDAAILYKITIPKGSSISGLDGIVGAQGMGLYGGGHQVYIDYRAIPNDWLEIIPQIWG